MGQSIKTVADKLNSEQVKQGAYAGTWTDVNDFIGSIVAGMVSAYKSTCNSAYQISAERGGDYILLAAQGNFYGDEAFTLTGLSEISNDPYNNPWRKAVRDFYSNVKELVGTKSYIAQFTGIEPSTAVFYLANHVVAAYYVDAKDKQIWRQGLIDQLVQVDDYSNSPVMTFGVAVWALAESGPLDNTFVDPSREGKPYWNLVTLADLPELLLSHQVHVSEPNAGSFYCRFDHERGFARWRSGYTEDTIFSTFGLIAAQQANSTVDLEDSILAARLALLKGIGSDGKVWEYLSHQGFLHDAYAGEMLQILGALIAPGDLNIDGLVNFLDFTLFGDNLRAFRCTGCNWCNWADINGSGRVDFTNFATLAGNWLKGVIQ